MVLVGLVVAVVLISGSGGGAGGIGGGGDVGSIVSILIVFFIFILTIVVASVIVIVTIVTAIIITRASPIHVAIFGPSHYSVVVALARANRMHRTRAANLATSLVLDPAPPAARMASSSGPPQRPQ